METLGIGAIVMGGLVAIGAFFIKLFANSQREQGRVEERNEQQAKESEARSRADDVLAEHRDPDDVVGRLRKHDF